VSEKRWREEVSEKRCPRKGVREKVVGKGGERKGETQEKVVGKGFKRLQLHPFEKVAGAVETVTFNKGACYTKWLSATCYDKVVCNLSKRL
jgi:hypothetical protein